MHILRTVSTFAAVVLLTLAFSSHASVATAADQPGATLHLTWSAPGVSHQVFAVTITCSPNGGGEEAYMDVDAACADLASANGDFEALPGYWFINCESYQGWAILTTATGDWFSQPVSYNELHANVCEARKATGPVFVF